MAPATRGAAREVPVWRVVPPWPSDTSTSSPGATTKRYLSLLASLQALEPGAIRQASPGVLEKFEIVPSRPTEPTIRITGLREKSQGTFVVCCTPSLPAA